MEGAGLRSLFGGVRHGTGRRSELTAYAAFASARTLANGQEEGSSEVVCARGQKGAGARDSRRLLQALALRGPRHRRSRRVSAQEPVGGHTPGTVKTLAVLYSKLNDGRESGYCSLRLQAK